MSLPPPPVPGDEEPSVQLLPASRGEEAAAVMAAALATSPAYAYTLRGTLSCNESALQWILSHNIAIMRRKNPASPRAVLDHDGAVLAAFILYSPDEVMNECDIAGSDLRLIPTYYGGAVFSRMREVLTWVAHADQEAYDDRPASEVLVLSRLGVRRDVQGRGLGSVCVRRAVEEAEAAGKILRLATQEFGNMQLYTRLGFDVVSQKRFDSGSHVFDTWFMESRPGG